MKRSIAFIPLAILCGCMYACNGQTNNTPQAVKAGSNPQQRVGGPCDGCEIMYVGMPAVIFPTDTSAGWHEPGQKLRVRGTVYRRDGKTPAAGVVLYYWQTDNNGYYSPRDGMDEKAKRHGHIRGWMKTDADGNYALYTLRPAPYPNEEIPSHIHILILEPGIGEPYYIDDLVFDDDPLVTAKERAAMQNRGGNGILKTTMEGVVQVARHDIILGLHIPHYPK
ncbi:MAG: hypothetical protein MUE58_11365 [Chitinophagaceae bacterium]|jgi:protocatechuate 3,4-dioxygenase beta subunit|nr:hypothetical protein [Chitinophagaceae bacterium]